MLELVSKVPISSIFVNAPLVGSVVGFGRSAIKLYNATSPVEAIPRAIVDILIDCSPPQIKYPLKCGVLVAQIAICAASGANPFSVGLIFAAGNQILKEKIL